MVSAGLLSGCGESAPEEGTTPAPSASDFPAPGNRTIEELADTASSSDYLVAPAGKVFEPGRTRYSFAVLDKQGSQVNDQQVAIYATRGPKDKVIGPFPASIESLATDPSFSAQTTSQDPGAAKAVYVTELDLPSAGSWYLLAYINAESGPQGAQLPTIKALKDNNVAAVGEPAPRVSTPIPADVGGDISKIDTRIPADSMHRSDLQDVLGKKPVILVFSTPQLCESRVCGPVVDVQAQVAEEMGDRAEFIHSEIYNDNDANKGVRPPVKAFGLPSEPWLFAIDENGIVRDRIEGPFGIEEVRRAVEKATS
ncbi:MAG: thioredoxin family protein [Solirubrobacterales bacterium]|nr:thioredoxin family protein [Solirubrobacterales bacterium]